MSREVIDLSPGQLHKLADLIHQQEVEKLKELKFNSYEEQQKYLHDSKDARDKVYHMLESTQELITHSEDATKQDIAHDVYGYCTWGIRTALQFIRSYHTRLAYLDKMKIHTDDLIRRLNFLDPATQEAEAQQLALEAITYRKEALKAAEKFQHLVPNAFSKLLKENKTTFEELVERSMEELKFPKPFKDLDNIRKLQVYESIIEEAGHGHPVVTYTEEALGKVGVGFLVFTAAMMVWDIYTAEDKPQAAVRDSVNALTGVVGVPVGDVVNAAVAAGFEALDIEIASAAVMVIGAVSGIGAVVLIGVAANVLLDKIFSSGTAKVKIADELTACCLVPMPDGLQVARLIKQKYPDL